MQLRKDKQVKNTSGQKTVLCVGCRLANAREHANALDLDTPQETARIFDKLCTITLTDEGAHLVPHNQNSGDPHHRSLVDMPQNVSVSPHP